MSIANTCLPPLTAVKPGGSARSIRPGTGLALRVESPRLGSLSTASEMCHIASPAPVAQLCAQSLLPPLGSLIAVVAADCFKDMRILAHMRVNRGDPRRHRVSLSEICESIPGIFAAIARPARRDRRLGNRLMARALSNRFLPYSACLLPAGVENCRRLTVG